MATDIAVIIPALNEQESVGLVVRELNDVLSRMSAIDRRSIFVIDNGSTDDTALRARTAGATIIFESRRGYGAACFAGLAVVPQGTDIVLFLDADHSIDVEQVPELLEPIIADRADFVLGRRIPLDPKALMPAQRFGNALACYLIRQFYGHPYEDLSPFRAIRWEALQALDLQDRSFGWTIEMQIRAVRRGLRIIEIPVRYRSRIGVSKISGTWSGTIKAGYGIIGTIIKEGLR